MRIRTNYIIRIKKPNLKLKMKLSTYMYIRNILLYLKNSIFSFLDFLVCYKIQLFTVLWCFVIFMFSNQVASESGNLSSTFYNGIEHISILKNLFSLIPIRKCAHLFLYFVLGFLVYFSLMTYTFKPFRLSLFYCYIYACFDEIHQLFVVGRNCSFVDTLIDLFGCVIALVLVKIIKRLAYIFKK